MFERYEAHAKRAIFYAKIEAREHDCAYVEVEHLLIGILREVPLTVEELTSTPFALLKHDAWKLAQERQPRRTDSLNPSLGGEVPLSAELIHVIENAAAEADRASQHKINPMHLLVALLSEEGSAVAEFLRARKVTLDKLRPRLAEWEFPSIAPASTQPHVNLSRYGAPVGPEILFVLQDGRRISSTLTLDYVPRLKERVRLSLERGYTSEFTVVDVRYDYKLVELSDDGGTIQRLKTIVIYLKPRHGRDEEEYSSLT